MSTTITLSKFAKDYINNSRDTSTTKVDKTLKAIINTYNRDSSITSSSTFIEYLNKLRTLYFLERLKYYNPTKGLEIKSKITFLLKLLLL